MLIEITRNYLERHRAFFGVDFKFCFNGFNVYVSKLKPRSLNFIFRYLQHFDYWCALGNGYTIGGKAHDSRPISEKIAVDMYNQNKTFASLYGGSALGRVFTVYVELIPFEKHPFVGREKLYRREI